MSHVNSSSMFSKPCVKPVAWTGVKPVAWTGVAVGGIALALGILALVGLLTGNKLSVLSDALTKKGVIALLAAGGAVEMVAIAALCRRQCLDTGQKSKLGHPDSSVALDPAEVAGRSQTDCDVYDELARAVDDGRAIPVGKRSPGDGGGGLSWLLLGGNVPAQIRANPFAPVGDGVTAGSPAAASHDAIQTDTASDDADGDGVDQGGQGAASHTTPSANHQVFAVTGDETH